MHKLTGLLFLCTLLFRAPTLCASGGPTLFLSIDPMLLFVNPGLTQDVHLNHQLGNTYIDQTGPTKKTFFSISAGLRPYHSEQLQINTGLRYIPVSSVALQGQIWQLKSPLFDDMAYHFQVKSHIFLVDNIISWTRYRLQPGVVFGLGVSANKADRFQEVPLTETAAFSLQTTKGATTTQVAYELGTVLDYSINHKSLIELAYRYIRAGTGHLQPFSLQNTTEHLSTGTLKYSVFSIGFRAYYEW